MKASSCILFDRCSSKFDIWRANKSRKGYLLTGFLYIQEWSLKYCHYYRDHNTKILGLLQKQMKLTKKLLYYSRYPLFNWILLLLWSCNTCRQNKSYLVQQTSQLSTAFISTSLEENLRLSGFPSMENYVIVVRSQIWWIRGMSE